MTKTLRFLARVVLLALVAAPLAAQPVTRIAGVVRDSTGAVLPGATVTLSAPTLRGGPHVVVTAADGRYEFIDLRGDDYVMEVTLSGFSAVRREVKAASGTTSTVDVMLEVSSFIESVTVTATKMGETNIQATPIAITALPAKALEQVAIESIEDLAGFAPTLTISQNTGMAQVTIRGIGTNGVFTGSDPSSTVHVDGVYLARPNMVFSDFLNVERVEVLRGPQGTLYGRNSVGGTINIISKQPTNNLEASVRFTAGDYSKFRTEASISGPIVKDKVMANFAIIRGTRDGFVEDLNNADNGLGGEDFVAAKTQIRFVFGASHQLLLSGDYGHYEHVPLSYSKPILAKPGFHFDSPADLHKVRHSHASSSDTSQGGGSGKLSLKLSDAVTLTSLTAWRKTDYRVFIDSDMTELTLLTTDIHDMQHQFSEEVTLVGHTPRASGVGGFYFFDEDDRQPSIIRLFAARLDNSPNPHVDARAWAFFGQGTYHLDDRWSVTGGLRYTSEEKTLETSGGLFRLGTTTPGVPASIYAFTDRISFDAWTPKAGVEFQVNRDVLAYVSATRGFKSGGFNFTAPEAGRGFAPEIAWSYEGGVKSTLAGGRARLNVAAFYNDYTDLQVQSFIRPGIVDVTNAAEATIKGVEVEAAVVPASGFQLLGSLSWLDAAYDRYVAIGQGGVTTDAAGLLLNNAPQWSGTGSAQYELGLGTAGTLALRGDVSWQSRVFFTPFNDAIETQEGYALVHLRAGFESESRRWELAFYVRNATDLDYITGTGSFPPPAIGGRPGDPRSFGTHLTVRY